jgi:hypothetical protein
VNTGDVIGLAIESWRKWILFSLEVGNECIDKQEGDGCSQRLKEEDVTKFEIDPLKVGEGCVWKKRQRERKRENENILII